MMDTRITTGLIIAILLLLPTVLPAQKPGTFNDAKAISLKSGLPILLEFARES